MSGLSRQPLLFLQNWLTQCERRHEDPRCHNHCLEYNEQHWTLHNLGLVSLSPKKTQSHWNFFESSEFLPNSFSVTFLTGHYWSPGPAAPSASVVLMEPTLLCMPVDRGASPQPQPFRVGVTFLAPAFVWSSSLHSQNGYILGTFIKPVRIPLNPSFLQVVLLLNGKLSSVFVLLSVWFWTQLIEQPWHSPYFRESFLRDHYLFSPNHSAQISSSCPVFSWGVACFSLRFWSMFGAVAVSSKCLSKPVLLWLQRVWSLAIVFTPAPLITFALTRGMSEEFTAGMKLGSSPRAIIESWVTFTVFHKVYRTPLVAMERVYSRVVLKTLGKHKIMV